MENTECPRCGELTIKPIDKIKAGKWLNIHCTSCGSRMCANPVVLALMYFVLLWDIFFFGFMAVHEKSLVYAVVMFVGWAIMEFFIYYVPLSVMKVNSKQANDG